MVCGVIFKFEKIKKTMTTTRKNRHLIIQGTALGTTFKSDLFDIDSSLATLKCRDKRGKLQPYVW